jgi:hypothetical protein
VLDLTAPHALAYAVSLAQPVLALHMSPTEEEAERFQREWHAWGDHLPLSACHHGRGPLPTCASNSASLSRICIGP